MGSDIVASADLISTHASSSNHGSVEILRGPPTGADLTDAKALGRANDYDSAYPDDTRDLSEG
jgi:hypothetical protein